MTDKEKIREEVERLINELIQEKERGYGSDVDDACILELQNVLTYIDSLQEEPIEYNPFDDFRHTYSEEPVSKPQVKESAKIQHVNDTCKENGNSLTQEPVSKDLEEAAKKAGQKYFPDEYNIWARQNYEARYAEYSFIDGAQWQKENIWKPADGDDLPEIDREVIVLTQKYPLKGSEYAVSFAHRPYKGKYIGKSLTTGNIETFENKTYDKGCWNQPDVRWWLDAELPKEIEL